MSQTTQKRRLLLSRFGVTSTPARITIAAIAALGLLLSPLTIDPAVSGEPSDYEIKAAYLYNFAKFIEWPDGSPANQRPSMVIGIVGLDPFGTILEEGLAGRVAQGRPFEILRFDELEDVTPCHFLFIAEDPTRFESGTLTKLSTAGVVTIAEDPTFAERGGIIEFLIEQRRVRFEINLAAAQSAGLRISSKLMNLAAKVHWETPSPDSTMGTEEGAE